MNEPLNAAEILSGTFSDSFYNMFGGRENYDLMQKLTPLAIKMRDEQTVMQEPIPKVEEPKVIEEPEPIEEPKPVEESFTDKQKGIIGSFKLMAQQYRDTPDKDVAKVMRANGWKF